MGLANLLDDFLTKSNIVMNYANKVREALRSQCPYSKHEQTMMLYLVVCKQLDLVLVLVLVQWLWFFM